MYFIIESKVRNKIKSCFFIIVHSIIITTNLSSPLAHVADKKFVNIKTDKTLRISFDHPFGSSCEEKTATFVCRN